MENTTTNQYIIRNATKADLKTVYQIDNDAFAPYGTVEETSIIAARLISFPDAFLVIEEKATGQLLGYATAEKWLEDRSPALNEHPQDTHQPKGHIFCITAMAIISAKQNSGLGSHLLNALIEIARQHHCEYLILETSHARNFYVQHGFQEIGTRTDMNAHLYIMKRQIDTIQA